MKKTYSVPRVNVVGMSIEVPITTSIQGTQGAKDLRVGGTTGEHNITSGNVKTNPVDWDDWKE